MGWIVHGEPGQMEAVRAELLDLIAVLPLEPEGWGLVAVRSQDSGRLGPVVGSCEDAESMLRNVLADLNSWGTADMTTYNFPPTSKEDTDE